MEDLPRTEKIVKGCVNFIDPIICSYFIVLTVDRKDSLVFLIFAIKNCRQGYPEEIRFT